MVRSSHRWYRRTFLQLTLISVRPTASRWKSLMSWCSCLSLGLSKCIGKPLMFKKVHCRWLSSLSLLSLSPYLLLLLPSLLLPLLQPPASALFQALLHLRAANAANCPPTWSRARGPCQSLWRGNWHGCLEMLNCCPQLHLERHSFEEMQSWSF